MFEGPEFDPELQRVQDLLQRDALIHAAPAGLATRVYQASVALLPRERVRGTTRAWSAAAARIPTWGRLALAASIAIAFGLASRLVESPRPSSAWPELSGPMVAVLDEDPGQGIQDLIEVGEMTLDDLRDDIAIFTADLGESDT